MKDVAEDARCLFQAVQGLQEAADFVGSESTAGRGLDVDLIVIGHIAVEKGKVDVERVDVSAEDGSNSEDCAN